MAAYRIRPFEGTAGEYEAVVVLQNLVEPNRPNSVASWRHWDEVRDPGRDFQRWLVEADGQLVAQGWLMLAGGFGGGSLCGVDCPGEDGGGCGDVGIPPRRLVGMT